MGKNGSMLCCAAVVALAGQVMADDIVEIPAFDRGQYDNTGYHLPTSINWLVGEWNEGAWHNFFVYDLTGWTDRISAVDLIVVPAWYHSPDESETYTLYSVETPLDVLLSGNGGLDAFDDLAVGLVYGENQVDGTIIYDDVVLTLNDDFVEAFNAARGGYIVLGGAITSLDDDLTTKETWGGHNHSLTETRLSVTIVPAPGTLSLLAAGFTAFRRRRE